MNISTSKIQLRTKTSFLTAKEIKGFIYAEIIPEIEKLKVENEILRKNLEYSANQLEGVSLAIRTHGQNINTNFFIVEYAKMAQEKRDVLNSTGEADSEN